MPDPNFATTQWHVVRNAGDADSAVANGALQQLCQQYWYPLYVYVRRQGLDSTAAEDLTQAFFADLLEREDIRDADPSSGKFRAFLLAAIKHFLHNQWKRERAQKRGGGRRPLSIDFAEADSRYRGQPFEQRTPETLFERQWALTLLDEVRRKLAREFEQRGRKHVFERLKPYLGGKGETTIAETAAHLGMTEVATKVAIHRMRVRFGEILRAEILNTLDSPDDLDAEIDHLFRVLRT